MKFVGVKHERVAWNAVAQRTLVMKALHACEGATDRVSVVAMRVVTVAAEPRFDTLDATGSSAADDPVGGGGWVFFSIHEGVSRFCTVLSEICPISAFIMGNITQQEAADKRAIPISRAYRMEQSAR